MKWLLELLTLPAQPNCPTCDGDGLVTVQGCEWLATVCVCPECDGTGKAAALARKDGE